MKGSMKNFMMVVIITVMGTFMVTSMALAGDKHLRGLYSSTGTAVCLSSAAGFNENLTPRDKRNFLESMNMRGVSVFNGDGTGYQQGRFVSVFYGPPNGGFTGAGSSEFYAPFTYEITPGGIITVSCPNSTGRILTGPLANQTWTVDQINLKGILTNNENSFALVNEEPQIEKTTFSSGTAYSRICHRSRILIRLD